MYSLAWFQYDYLLTASRLSLAFIFLSSAVNKFQNMPGFISMVLDYQVLPILWARKFAVVLPWLEISIGLLLVLGLSTQIAAGLSIMLLFSFIFAMGVNLLHGRSDLDCGCGGTRHKQKISIRLLLRNIFLLFLASYVMLSGPDILALDSQLLQMTRPFIFHDVILPLAISLGGAVLLCRIFIQMMRLVQLEDNQ